MANQAAILSRTLQPQALAYRGVDYRPAERARLVPRRIPNAMALQSIAGPSPAMAGFRVEAWDGSTLFQPVQAAWSTLLASRRPDQVICQTPAFFRYVKETKPAANILTVNSTADDLVCGVVPIVQSTLTLPFALREWTLFKLRLKSLEVLGNEPIVVEQPGALDGLFSFINDSYPKSQVIDLYSVPHESALWAYLHTSSKIKQLYHVHVLHGLRETHCVTVPASIDSYYGGLTKKRRYNLLRQERLLQKHLDSELDLVVIDNPEHLPLLYEAIDELGIPKGHRSLLTRAQYESAAANGVLRCFVLKAGIKTVAVALGIRSENACMIHRFFHDKSLSKLSPGTTLWQLVLRHLISEGTITKVAMGYGSPAYRFHSTTVAEKKGRVLLFRRTFANRCRILAHRGFSKAIEFVKSRIGQAAPE